MSAIDKWSCLLTGRSFKVEDLKHTLATYTPSNLIFFLIAICINNFMNRRRNSFSSDDGCQKMTISPLRLQLMKQEDVCVF